MANLLPSATTSLDPWRSESQRRGGADDDDVKEPTVRPTVGAKEDLADVAGNRRALVAITDDTNNRPVGNGNSNVGSGSIVAVPTASTPKQQRCHRLRPESTRLSLASSISPKFTEFMPFELCVKIARSAPYSSGLVDKIWWSLPPTQRELFLRCYYRCNWAYLQEALPYNNHSIFSFNDLFSTWLNYNEDFPDTIVTATGIPTHLRGILTNPAFSVLYGSVLLLRHILEKTNTDVNGLHCLREGDDQAHLIVFLIIREGGPCAEYLLSRRSGVDVFRHILSDDGRPVVVQALRSAVESCQKLRIFQQVLQHPSCDVNRRFFIRDDGPRSTILAYAVREAIWFDAGSGRGKQMAAMKMILVAGANPHLSPDVRRESPFEFAQRYLAHGSQDEARRAQDVLTLLRIVPAAVRIASMVRGYLTRRRLRVIQ